MTEPAEDRELSLLRKASDFPTHDAARDARVKKAMGKALGAGPRAAKRSVRRTVIIASAAAAVLAFAAFGTLIWTPEDSKKDLTKSRYQVPAEVAVEETEEDAPDIVQFYGQAKFSRLTSEEMGAFQDRSESSHENITGGVDLGFVKQGSPVRDVKLIPDGFHNGRSTRASLISGLVPIRNLTTVMNLEERSAAQGLTSATTWKPAQATPHASRLLVGDKETLPLQAIEAQARVDGFRARIIFDLYYLNDRAQQLEGNFQLRLPDGASPFFLAFGQSVWEAKDLAGRPGLTRTVSATERDPADNWEPAQILKSRAASWTSVQEARVVPREKAAFAYRETVRRVVDPALLEWSGTGVFSARVFPLAPGKVHRITLGYDLDLLRAGDDLVLRLDLPAGSPTSTLEIDAAEPAGAKLDVEPAAEARRSDGRAGGRARWRFDDPRGPITLALKGAGALLLEGSDEKTGPYFAASFRPELPSGQAAGGAAAVGNNRAVILVDTSLSSSPSRFPVWLKLLRAILEENRASLREFAVLFFNVEAHWWREGFAENDAAAAEALLAYADRLALEGATDLRAALAEAAAPRWLAAGDKAPFDLFVLSDGAPTWGERDAEAPAALLRSAGRGPLFAFSTGVEGSTGGVLARLARETGGGLFSAIGEGEIKTAATAHRERPWLLAGYDVEGGSDLVIAGRPAAIYRGQSLILAGRGKPAADAEAVLKLRRGSGENGEEITVRTRLDRRISSELAARTYGQIAVAQLEELGVPAEDYSRSYATHFRVSGETCSLLLLEREEDYQRYGLKPEEDALLVRGQLASRVVARALAEAAATARDAKAGFFAWLKKLEKAPGVSLSLGAPLRLSLENLPAKAFEVDAGRLAAKLRTWDGVPGGLQEDLAGRRLDYDRLFAEALRRLRELGAGDALKALSSLREEDPGDPVLARDLAFSALEWGLGGQAYHLLREVAAARPWEPGTYTALAGALAGMGKPELALAFYELALAGQWDGRFGDFRRIAGLEYLRFLRGIVKGGIVKGAEKGPAPAGILDLAQARLETLERELGAGKADLSVVISWNTDGTDVDLHVVEPSGEECFYKHAVTKIGGRITPDVTQGYGPEMYTLRDAVAGTYRITAHYFASDQNRLSARTKVYATIVRNVGSPDEKVEHKTVMLEAGKSQHEIAAITVER